MSVPRRRIVIWLVVAGAAAAIVALMVLPPEARMWTILAPIMLYLGLLTLVAVGACVRYAYLAAAWTIRGRRVGWGFRDWMRYGWWWPDAEEADPPISHPAPPRRPR